MKHKDYLFEMNPYTLLDGVKELQENNELEMNDFNELILAITSGSEPSIIENKLDDFLSILAKNYFCRGFKIGIAIALSLDKDILPDCEE